MKPAHTRDQDNARPWWDRDAGLEAVEYALIAALLLAGILIAIPANIDAFTNAYSAITTTLSNALSAN